MRNRPLCFAIPAVLTANLWPGPVQAQEASIPRAVTVARATEIPACALFVDAAATADGSGSIAQPFGSIGAAVEAADPGAVICVAEGRYAEALAPGTKYFTLAGGFQSGSDFAVRDSSLYITQAVGSGGSFLRIEDPGPTEGQLTAIDGFDISGYAQAVYRDYYVPQRFDLTNNHIHDNVCDESLVGAGFALNNITGTISGNVIRNNSCGRGGAGFLNDATQQTVRIERNLIDGNAGTEPTGSHGGALYLFGSTLHITGNLFTRNSVTQWGAGLYIGAYRPGGQPTNATLSWNVYRDNRASNAGGGMFCDDGAECTSLHEIYQANCGGNIYLDGGDGPTAARFTNVTSVSALDTDCRSPGAGVRIDNGNTEADAHSFVNAIFWGNGVDLAANCNAPCPAIRVDISYSLIDRNYANGGIGVSFGEGIVAPADPLFADAPNGDFHLKSAAGRWTQDGPVKDDVTSPVLAKGDPKSDARDNPAQAGGRVELGAFGNSAEASYVK